MRQPWAERSGNESGHTIVPAHADPSCRNGRTSRAQLANRLTPGGWRGRSLPALPPCDKFHKRHRTTGRPLLSSFPMASETTLRPGEIKDILLREIEAADLHELDVEEVGTVLEVKDGIARIYGLSKAMSGEMLEVTASESGEKITALALNLEEDNIGAVIL